MSDNLPAVAEKPKVPQAPMNRGNRGLILNSLDDMWRFADCVLLSGMAPKGLDNRSALVIALQLGFELGLSPMCAVQNICVINGRPGLYGDVSLGLVRDSGLLEDHKEWYEGEGDKLVAHCLVKRKGESEAHVSTYTVDDAKRAALWDKDLYKKHPKRMLLARARGYALRDKFSDVLRGLRTEDELTEIADAEVVARPAKQIQAGNGNGNHASTPATPAASKADALAAKLGNTNGNGKKPIPEPTPQPTNGNDGPPHATPSEANRVELLFSKLGWKPEERADYLDRLGAGTVTGLTSAQCELAEKDLLGKCRDQGIKLG